MQETRDPWQVRSGALQPDQGFASASVPAAATYVDVKTGTTGPSKAGAVDPDGALHLTSPSPAPMSLTPDDPSIDPLIMCHGAPMR